LYFGIRKSKIAEEGRGRKDGLELMSDCRQTRWRPDKGSVNEPMFSSGEENYRNVLREASYNISGKRGEVSITCRGGIHSHCSHYWDEAQYQSDPL
jgi:hypothetical protein